MLMLLRPPAVVLDGSIRSCVWTDDVYITYLGPMESDKTKHKRVYSSWPEHAAHGNASCARVLQVLALELDRLIAVSLVAARVASCEGRYNTIVSFIRQLSHLKRQMIIYQYMLGCPRVEHIGGISIQQLSAMSEIKGPTQLQYGNVPADKRARKSRVVQNPPAKTVLRRS